MEVDFDEFEGDDDEGFGGVGGGVGEDGEGLGYLGLVEEFMVEFVLFVVGGEFGGVFWGFYEDGGGDVVVEVGEVGERGGC